MARRGEEEPHEVDLEKGASSSRSVQHPLAAAEESEGSICFSDAEDQSWHSPYNSHCAGSSSFDEFRLSCASGSEIGSEEPGTCRNLCDAECSADDSDLETGLAGEEIKGSGSGSPDKVDRDCRICHLSLENTPESGVPMELGCSCKHDLAVAHRQCAETWFKIKGNKICEICGSMAKNVVGTTEAELIEQWNETSSNPPPPAAPPAEPARSFWQGRRFLNFLLACMVFAFVISWLFHFNVPG